MCWFQTAEVPLLREQPDLARFACSQEWSDQARSCVVYGVRLGGARSAEIRKLKTVGDEKKKK